MTTPARHPLISAGLLLGAGLCLYRLFRAGSRPDVPWSGSILLGGGLFNAVEGTVDHFMLGIHHVLEYAGSHFPADAAFVASGLLLMAAGWGLIGRGARNFASTRAARPRHASAARPPPPSRDPPRWPR